MNAMKSAALVLVFLSQSLACDADKDMGVFTDGPDGAIASAADASVPVPPPADADVPTVYDAAPVETPPDDLPVELACSIDEVQPILTCVTDNCLDSIADGTLLTCVTFSCGLLLLTLPPDCSQCILTGLTNPTGALDACVSGLDDLGGGFPLPPAP